jgi:dTDP-4-amino-4,6-dideoxygalactose transaminase
MEEWIELCQDKNIYLIEDCAQAHQSEWSGKPAGSWGDIGSYSFYPTKNLGAMGDAGMIVSNRRDVYENSIVLRNYGQTERYYHEKIGFNSRLDEIQAVILNIRLSFLSDFTKRRIDVAKRYNQNINNELIEKLSIPEQDKSHVYHLYVIKTKYRNRLQSFLQENNIQTYIHYPIPVHKQKALDNIKIKYSDLKNSERYANECLSIPCNHVLKEHQVNRIIETINSFRI